MTIDLHQLDERLRPLAEPIAQRLVELGTDADGLNPWHAARARSLRAGVRSRVESCATTAVIFACGCGEQLKPKRCKQHKVCPDCAKGKWAGVREDVERSLAHAYEQARALWLGRGKPAMWEPRLALMTFTVQHSGNMGEDLKLLTKGWARWRAWLLRQPGVSEAPAFARVAEYTDSDGGHTHHHVVAILPWIDYAKARSAWARATDGAGTQWDCRSRRWKGARVAAGYLGKYITKGPQGHSPDVLARWLAATYMARLLTVSQGFWRRLPRTCPCCQQRFELTWIQPHWMDIGGLERFAYARLGRDPPRGDYE